MGQGLVSYWTFDNTLDDAADGLPTDSAVADNGAFVGEPDVGYSAEGLFGSSLEQNGGTGYVEVQASSDTLRETDNALTVSAWIKVPAFSANWQAVISHGEGNQWRVARRSEESTLAFAGGAPDIPGAGVGPSVEDGEWHHIVAISDPDLFVTTLYIDGEVIAEGAGPEITDEHEGIVPNLFIGSNPQRPNRAWNGQIDDLALWSRALTDAEVQSIYADGGTSIADLLGGAGRPVITNIVRNADDTVTLTWPSSGSSDYAVFVSQDLTSENWFEESDSVANGGDTTTYTTAAYTQEKIFFRIEKK